MAPGRSLDQKSRWLSLSITVSLPTNGVPRLSLEEQRLVLRERCGGEKGGGPLELRALVGVFTEMCGSGRSQKHDDRYEPRNNYGVVCLLLSLRFPSITYNNTL